MTSPTPPSPQEVVTATIDLEEIRTYRNRIRSRQIQAAAAPSFPRVEVEFSLSRDGDLALPSWTPIQVRTGRVRQSGFVGLRESRTTDTGRR